MIVVLFGESRMRASAAQRRQRFLSRSKVVNRDIVQGSAVAIHDNFGCPPRDGKNRAGIAVHHVHEPARPFDCLSVVQRTGDRPSMNARFITHGCLLCLLAIGSFAQDGRAQALRRPAPGEAMAPHAAGVETGARAPAGPFIIDSTRSSARLLNEAMAVMSRDMAHAPMTGNPDHDFATMMIPHHQGAIDMAKVEVLYGKDPVLRRLAQEIIVTQDSEIAVMRMQLQKHSTQSSGPQ
jgi:hypothetical protein